MRAPVLPQTRERLWAAIAGRLDVIESGLELVLEGLDCSGGQHGCMDGLARDGSGAPVLVALAVSDDALLLPRIVQASDFLGRVGDALATAVPEGNFCSGVAPRVLVIGTETAEANLRALLRLQLPAVEMCRLEVFRIADSERFAVRWLDRTAVGLAESSMGGGVAPFGEVSSGHTEFADNLSSDQDDHWAAIARLCERLDPGVRIDGDRFRRRITWHGRPLGQAMHRDGILCAVAADGSEHAILSMSDVRAFGDLLIRRYADLAGLRMTQAPTAPATGACAASPRPSRTDRSTDRSEAMMPRIDSLRSAMADALLSPEEFAALAGPTDPAVPDDSPG